MVSLVWSAGVEGRALADEASEVGRNQRMVFPEWQEFGFHAKAVVLKLQRVQS